MIHKGSGVVCVGGPFALCINNPPQMKKKRDENDKNVQNSEHWDNVVDSCGRRE